MPYFHGRHDGRAAYIQVAVIDAARYREHRQSANPYIRNVKSFKALIDTGASTTMVTERVVREAGLVPVNKKLWHGADGDVWRTAYLFRIAFEGETIQIGDSEEDGISKITNLHVCTKVINGGGIDDEPSWDVLLGMDIIATGILTIDKGGEYSFAF